MNIFHHDFGAIVLSETDEVNWNDIGVLKTSHRQCLIHEIFGQMGFSKMKSLDGNITQRKHLPGSSYNTHAPLADDIAQDDKVFRKIFKAESGRLYVSIAVFRFCIWGAVQFRTIGGIARVGQRHFRDRIGSISAISTRCFFRMGHPSRPNFVGLVIAVRF